MTAAVYRERTGADVVAFLPGSQAPLSIADLEAELIDLGIASVPADAEWQERGLCKESDPEIFFPEKGGSTREAKAVCLRCPVRDNCLEEALAQDERFGIWGGLSERERRRLQRGVI